MDTLAALEPTPRKNDIAYYVGNGRWRRIKPSDYMALLSVLEANLPSVSRSIPFYVTTTALGGSGRPLLADETATSELLFGIPVPPNWDSTSDIVLKTVFIATSTGLVDLETQIIYVTETDESAATTVQAFTNTNLTWTSANTYKTLTTTITAANIAAGRHFEVTIFRNTGDANTGSVTMAGARAYTGTK